MPDTPEVTGEVGGHDAGGTGTKLGLSLSQVCPKSVPSDIAAVILETARENIGIQILIEKTGQTNRTRFRNSIINPLIEAGLIEMTIPDKPRSSKQKYRLTGKGRAVVKDE